jgi:broad specificity phosphatase PhoE
MYPLILVRHGQSEHHVAGLTGGWTDTSLTELGRRQVHCLASRLAREVSGRPCRVYCSDLKRAMETADVVGRALGAEPITAPGLREFNNGTAAGMSEEAAGQHLRRLTGSPLDWRPYPGAETWREFYVRISRCLGELATGQDRLLLAVTHGGAIVNAVAWWLQLEVEMLSRVSFYASPASISVLRFNQWGERAIERLNDTAHLYAEGLADGIQLDQGEFSGAR